MSTWQLQDAKARFSEVIDTALENGPQIITRRGKDTAVLLSVEEWKRLSAWHNAASPQPEPPLKRMSNGDFLKLLQSAPDFDIPDRHTDRARTQRAREK